MIYKIYNKLTGQVLKDYSGQDPELQINDDTDFIEVPMGYIATPIEYIEDGEIKAANKPNQFCAFDYIAKQWVENLDDAKTSIKGKINARAGELITKRLPQWKQANLTARAVELQGLPSLSQIELAEFDAIKAEWSYVKDIRVKSNIANSAIDLCETVDQVLTIEAMAFD